jgi:hypothetical protein
MKNSTLLLGYTYNMIFVCVFNQISQSSPFSMQNRKYNIIVGTTCTKYVNTFT